MIKVRKIDFEFPDDIPFYFNPENARMSMTANVLSFLAPAFERYFIKAIKRALPDIKNRAVREEADLFCKQEGLHAKAHIDHQNMLLRKYPALKALRDRVNQSYDELDRTESNAFALAYATTIELSFKPLAKFFIENRQLFFARGDKRIASFILWHFVEEFEHRSAMYNVYRDVVDDYWFRVKASKRTRAHVATLAADVRETCLACEPLPSDESNELQPPLISRAKLALGIFETHSPLHNPESGRVPQWITDWFAAEEAGQDMRTYFLGTDKTNRNS